MERTEPRLAWIGAAVAGAVLVVCYFLPAAWLMTGDGWSAKPASVPVLAGPYLFGAVTVVAAFALLAAKPPLRTVLVWAAIFLSLIASLSALIFENLLLLDCIEHGGRSPDLTKATTGRVAAVLIIAWPTFFLMLALLLRARPPQARYSRVLTLSGGVFVTWFACLAMAADVEYGLWISLLASAALTGCGVLAWRAERSATA